MTENDAHGQTFENGRKVGDAEGYARGKAEGVKHAYWIRTGRGMKCSNPECRCLSALWDDNLKSTFCPWCGARMDGDGDV